MKTTSYFAALFGVLLISATAFAQDAETRRLSNMLIGKWNVDEAACKKFNLVREFNTGGLIIVSLEFKADGEKVFTNRVRQDVADRFQSIRDPDVVVWTGADGHVYATLKASWQSPQVVDVAQQKISYKSISRTEQVREAAFARNGKLIEGNLIFVRE